MKNSIINIEVSIGDNKIPEKITWNSTDGSPNPSESKAFLLSFFDKETLDTVKIDLWTKDMQVVEMDRFFFQTLRGLADTYYKATQNNELASAMQQFVQYFGEKTQILKRE